MYLGLDRSSYPGDAVMASLYRDTNLYFTCFYLAPAPSHGERSWMGTRATLAAQGWGFLPTYVGQQEIGLGSHILTGPQGITDAHDADRLMRAAGFETGTVVYLDIENGLQMPARQVEYVKAWIRTVNEDTSYWPGVYCSKRGTAAQVRAVAGEDLPIWVYGPQRPYPTLPAGAPKPRVVVDPAAETGPTAMHPNYPDATAWQYLMSLNCVVDLRWTERGGAIRELREVDLSVSTVRDPSFSPAGDRGKPSQWAISCSGVAYTTRGNDDQGATPYESAKSNIAVSQNNQTEERTVMTTTAYPTNPAPRSPAVPAPTNAVMSGTAMLPTGPATLGPLAPPASGAASVPPEQLAGQALAASIAIGMAPYDLVVCQMLTLDQLLEIVRQRLAQLEALHLMSGPEVTHTEAIINARCQRKPLPQTRLRLAGDAAGGALTVTTLVQRAASGTPSRQLAEESFLGDLFHSVLDVAATILGGIEGFALAGPVGAIVGAMTAHEWIQQQDF